MVKRKKRGKNLTPQQAARIRELAAKGKSDQQLAVMFKRHPATIAKIRHGKFHAGNRANQQSKQPRQLTELNIDEATRLLQALSHEWPKIRESFQLLDSIVTGR